MADDKRDERSDKRDERPAGKRLFIGVRVSVQTANALAQACETLQRRAKDARPAVDLKWVAPANYHVTLKFLGFTREDAIGAVRDALDRELVGAQPVKFRTARLGAFASLDKANVLWAGVEAERGGPSSSSPLDDLYARVERAMTGIGYKAESRPFHAHVTLARLRETRPLKDLVLPLSEQMFSDTRIDGVTLFESETKSSGSVYRDLHRVGFKTAGFPDLATEKRQTGALELGDETQTDTDDGWPRGHGH
ncbi:MAG TPA: RNA 2',3'-cyclic phosphodiesterase [Kofleriaceae bacterium]|nr:RNA 2',3'-cyclic phosphodiesterase [Kofleriaceae bacterium]